MPKKGTVAYKREIVEIYYGINPDTFKVESVSRTREGTLATFRGGNYVSHTILPGRDPRSEIVVVFGLTNILAMPVALDSHDHPAVKELQAKAEKMKADADLEAQAQKENGK